MKAPQPAKILIILMGSLGDVARGIAIIDPLRRRFPESKISWLIEPKCEAFIRLHPEIDQVIVFDRKRGLMALPQLRRELRAEKFDLVLDMQRHFKSGLFSWFSGAPRRLGFNRRDAKEFNWVFNNDQIAKAPEDYPKLDHYMMFALHLGIKTGERPEFGLHKERDKQESQSILKSLPKKYCALVLGSSWHSKDWPPSGYGRLIQAILAETELSIVLLGDRSQFDIAQKLINTFNSAKIFNLANSTTLGQLVAVIDDAVFCVGPDSGPGHISGAVGTPYITLFGPTSPKRTAPFGSENLVVQAKLGCMPCYRRTCPGLDKLCMRLISADAVMEKVHSLTGTFTKNA